MPLEGSESNNLDKHTHLRGCETLPNDSRNLYELSVEEIVQLQMPRLLDVVESVRALEGGEIPHCIEFAFQSLIERRHCRTRECSMSLQISRVLCRKDFEEDIQGSAKRRGLGCINSLPGSAWL